MNISKEIYLTKQELSFSLEENVLLHIFEDNRIVYETLCRNNAFLIGGALTSVFSNAKINDLDFYFPTIEDYDKCYTELMVLSRARYESNSAVTFPHLISVPLQLIKKVIKPTIEDIFNEFDFTVCMGGYNLKKREFVFHHDFFKHLAQRELVFNSNSKNPVHALLRVEKYKLRGYTFKPKELYKVIGTIIAMKITTNEQIASLFEGMYNSRTQKIVQQLKSPEFAKEEFDFTKFIEMIEDSFYPTVRGLNPIESISVAEVLPF